MAQNAKKRRIQVVECKQCEFLVSVSKWRYSNLNEEHADACPKCLFSKQYQRYVAEREQEKQQKKQARLAELQQQKKRAEAEVARIAKEQQEFQRQRTALVINTSELRAKFFETNKWSLQYSSSQQLIDANLCFRSDDDDENLTFCYTCGIELGAWNKNENFYETHLKRSSQCLWLKEHHGELMIMRKHVCRRCSAKFPSNTKLHQHIQNHHQKKAEKSVAIESAMTAPSNPIRTSETAMSTSPYTSEAELAKSTSSELAKITISEFAEITSIAISAPITPFFTSKAPIAVLTPPATFSSTSESALLLTSSVSHSESTSDISLPLISSATPIATSRKSLFWAEIVSRSVIASKSSRLPIATPKIVSRKTKNASVVCPSTSPPIFSQKPVRKHQHQKFYLTIQDLFERFDEKPKKMKLLHTKQHTKKTESFPKISHQITITAYFKPAANQNTSISQSSKTSNSRSLHQHMSAESTRTTPKKSASEKSAISPYKTSTFFRLSTSEISSIPSYKMPDISYPKVASCKFSVHLSVSSTLRAFSNISDSRHTCRICSDTFRSNNDLHRHLRAIHFGHAPRHESEKHAPGRNTMTWRSLTC